MEPRSDEPDFPSLNDINANNSSELDLDDPAILNCKKQWSRLLVAYPDTDYPMPQGLTIYAPKSRALFIYIDFNLDPGKLFMLNWKTLSSKQQRTAV